MSVHMKNFNFCSLVLSTAPWYKDLNNLNQNITNIIAPLVTQLEFKFF